MAKDVSSLHVTLVAISSFLRLQTTPHTDEFRSCVRFISFWKSWKIACFLFRSSIPETLEAVIVSSWATLVVHVWNPEQTFPSHFDLPMYNKHTRCVRIVGVQKSVFTIRRFQIRRVLNFRGSLTLKHPYDESLIAWQLYTCFACTIPKASYISTFQKLIKSHDAT